MAEQLLTAAIMTEISDLGLTLEELAKQEKPIELHFNSVSLITPDILREMKEGAKSEKVMFEDQVKALQSFDGENTFRINNIPIKVNVNVNAFNFGVNTLAVRGGLGTRIQHSYNEKAFKGLQKQFKSFEEKIGASEDPTIKKELGEARSLLGEIEGLTKSPTAYLKGKGDPYDAPTKIIALTNKMNTILMQVNSGKEKDAKQRTGYLCGLNCMSGKDRTGVADAKASSEAVTSYINTKNPKIKKFFGESAPVVNKKEVFQTLLKKAGSLEVTKINTGVRGVKVGKEGGVNPTERGFSNIVSS